ncbi:ribosomal small subunit pseudouridine synthase A [Marinobacterium halophilum]|uniref:Pseudouridine synthase n=1 Tax=Marinobacterium halophilum TaxID=267374 RepID=A0A2P8EM07_9GAMM|nr:16S rRNA pseudouridine(516) synthase RsuA [Marinobacterium halophilum]PSL10514.1 ribosomal small subunit pseudouridine synthase A [Marinobacterium halophilum]
MRLDKYIAQVTDFSRKEVKRLLHADEVSVNGELERNPSRKISATDAVNLQGFPLEAPRTRYLMLYKPEGVVCSTDDPTHPTVLALLEMPRVERLNICGRLDVDTTGLVLLTDDGQWAHRVASPNHKTGKVYHVTTAAPIAADAIQAFADGIMLNGERLPTKPAELEILSEYEARVCLHEGRYHQVKRMFAAIGNRVESLHREQIGSICLDEMLEPGEYRELTADEIASI